MYKPSRWRHLGGFILVRKTAVLIDGGFLRVQAKKASKTYDPVFIEKMAHACIAVDEEPLRYFYYDCKPYVGKTRLPVSGDEYEFTGSDAWLRQLASKDLFAVRLGVLKFRGWVPKTIPISGAAISDDDFKPKFEQKGVDMRIGLDVAKFADSHTIERLVLMSADTDCVPALKYARIAGLQTVLARLPQHIPAPELTWHADFVRSIQWPA